MTADNRSLWPTNRISELRIAQGLSQVQMAQAMGWKGKSGHLRVSAVECGREWLGEASLKRMAEILKIPEKRMRLLLFFTWRDGYLNQKNRERRTLAKADGQ